MRLLDTLRIGFRNKARRASSIPEKPAGKSFIEPLEARIAPATLASPSAVTYQDSNGDIVTVTLSKSLLTSANGAKVFGFDTGSVNGDNSAHQQLQLLDISVLDPAAKGVNISITATNPVNVGYIDASGVDLGTVNVSGDLGRISAGDLNHATPGLQSLTVGSLGAQGIATQAAGGNLNTLLSGPIGSITVHGDIDNASIGIGGGGLGKLGSLTVTGSINGGTAKFSGSVRSQGSIGNIIVDGSINGGAGMSSGLIGTAGSIGNVTVGGDLAGGGGKFSGAILSTGPMAAGAGQSVNIASNVIGGSGMNSGEIGTASNLGAVIVGGSVLGGSGIGSGVILAKGNIKSVTVTTGLIGGSGAESGEIGVGKNAQSIIVGTSGVLTGTITTALATPQVAQFSGLETGSGPGSGSIFISGTVNSLTIGGNVSGPLFNAGIRPAINTAPLGSGAIASGGGILNLDITGSLIGGSVFSASSLGTVTIGGMLSNNSQITAVHNIGTVSVNADGSIISLAHAISQQPGEVSPGFGRGIDNSNIIAEHGNIGSINAGGGGFSGAYAINNAFISAHGTIGPIDAETIDGSDAAIINSLFLAGGGITSINAINPNFGETTGAIINSGFDTGGSIGDITTLGSISGSVFIAGINLGQNFSTTGAGGFDNSAAKSFGFGSSKSNAAAHIGNITVSSDDSDISASIISSTFLAGVHGPGKDKTFGTADDSVPHASSIGAISSDGGFDTSFFESGMIGTISGSVTSTTFLAIDS